MDFHIVKMYKDKWSRTKMSKMFFLSMCDVKIFLTFTSLSLVLLSGADPGLEVRGGALKKIAPSGGRRENIWGI
jgi:hypothetical protein